MALSKHEKKVSTYYDKNTGKFLWFGENKNTQNIHQALWAEGINTVEEAVNYANQLIVDEIKKIESNALQLLDLGCGVGSTLLYIAQQLRDDDSITGITISEKQAQIGNQNIERLGASKRCKIVKGSFQNLSFLGQNIDLAYAIEAFVHSPDASVFLQQISSKLTIGGQLILIDDFLAEGVSPEHPTVKDFCDGWVLGSLLAIDQVEKMSKKEGIHLVKKIDLTDYLDKRRPRDTFIRILTKTLGPLMEKSHYLHSLKGGDARQECIRTGLAKYQFLVFEKR